MGQSTLSIEPYVNSGLFTSHYLDEKVTNRPEWDCDEEAQEVMEKLQSLYELEKPVVEGYSEDALIDNWIGEVLGILGFGTQEEVTLPEGGGFVDELLFEGPTARREAAEVYIQTESTIDVFERGLSIVEAKQWDDDFTTRFSEQRPYRNASHQIKHYLENTTRNIQWGVLTNGRKWRLYGTNDYETQTYYEVDLPELLEQGNLEEFKYFYVFFRPSAFRKTAGTTFHDEVWDQSETASKELGEDLQNNVFTALRVLGRGFIETNDLDIEHGDDSLDTLKEQSLVLLYRLMFILYAESRGLIHPEGQAARDTYEADFSLDQLRLDIHDTIGEVDEGFKDEFSQHSRRMWSQLEDLFRLVDEGEDSLGIPPYNGGLFNEEKNEFLAENEVSNQHLAEVIYRLSTTRNEEGRYVLADYSDLDTRHLGSVYEGLLEHQFEIAPTDYVAIKKDGEQVWKPESKIEEETIIEKVPEGGLYVVNDEGKRKTTGAYYTPDYVVTDIVEETVEPLVNEIREDLIEQGLKPGTEEYLSTFAREVTDLRILDPAMGSGHFLTKATGYLAEQVMEEVREVESELGVAFNEQHVRRQIAKECIYGVDINSMAVELSKLSMWLETLAADRPLAFLDHHLKQGNSLVGSDIEDVLSTSEEEEREGQQTFEDVLAKIRQEALEHIMDLFLDLIDIENESISDINEMKSVFEEIEDNPQYQHLMEMANVYTAEQFGLNVPSNAQNQMAQAIQNQKWEEEIEGEDWFVSAQSIATDESFFHWKLEFPLAFFSENGEKKEDSGFDAVIGNPPYVSIENLEEDTVDYLQRSFDATESGRIDLYLAFIDQSNLLCKKGRRSSMIVPDKWLVSDYGEALREDMIQNYTMEEIWDLREANVFPGVSNSPVVYRVNNSTPDEEAVVEFKVGENKQAGEICPQRVFKETYENKIIIGLTQKKAKVIEEIGDDTERIRDFAYVSFGAQPGSLSKFVFDSKDSAKEGAQELDTEPSIEPFIRGRNIKSFSIDYDGEYLLYAPDELHRPAFRELFENEKIVISELSSTLNAAFDGDYLYGNEKVVFLVRGSDLENISDDIRRQRPIPDPETISDFGETINLKFLTTLLNSKLMEFYFENAVSDGLNVYPDDVRYLPIVKSTDAQEELANKCDEITKVKRKRNKLNLSLPDYLGNYTEGNTLSDLSPSSPDGLSDSILAETERSTDDFETLRVTSVKIQSDEDSLTISAVPYVKPMESVRDEFELNSRNYATLDPVPAMTFHDITDQQAALIKSFVPYAVANEDGYTDSATKTISLIDRLKSLTLPKIDDVEDDLGRYMEEVRRAEELDDKIQTHYKDINERVYELYGLDEDEIKIIEEEVNIR